MPSTPIIPTTSTIPVPTEPLPTKWSELEDYKSGNKSEQGIQVLKAIETLVESEGREIDPILLKGFNQKGRWAFISRLESLNPPNHHRIFLANFTLPKNKICEKYDGKLHLLTNFIFSDEKEILEIPYHKIDGCLIVKNSFYIKANHLEVVGGKVQLDRAKSLKVPKLQEVGGNFSIRMAHVISAPLLKKVDGELDIFHARAAELPKLSEASSLKIANLKQESQESLVKNLSLDSLEKIIESPSMSPSIQTEKIKKFIEKTIKKKSLSQKITSNKGHQTLSLS